MSFRAINLLLDSIALSSRPLFTSRRRTMKSVLPLSRRQAMDKKKGKKGKGKKPPMPY